MVSERDETFATEPDAITVGELRSNDADGVYKCSSARSEIGECKSAVSCFQHRVSAGNEGVIQDKITCRISTDEDLFLLENDRAPAQITGQPDKSGMGSNSAVIRNF